MPQLQYREVDELVLLAFVAANVTGVRGVSPDSVPSYQRVVFKTGWNDERTRPDRAGGVRSWNSPICRSGLAHDLEHARAALWTSSLHCLAAIGHNDLFGFFHVALRFALYAIRFNCCCHGSLVVLIDELWITR